MSLVQSAVSGVELEGKKEKEKERKGSFLDVGGSVTISLVSFHVFAGVECICKSDCADEILLDYRISGAVC